MLYEKWIYYIETKYKDNVRQVYFRDKSYGYATANVRIEMENKGIIEQKYDSKSLMKTFFSGYNMRPSCYDCPFRCVDRVSDFTMGDFHQIGDFCPEMDDDKGTTCLWIHTASAWNVFENIMDKMTYYVLDRNCSSALDNVSKKTAVPKDRSLFWKDANQKDYAEFSKKWAKNDIKTAVANIAKPIINKMPFRSCVFKLIKRIKQRNFQKRVSRANE